MYLVMRRGFVLSGRPLTKKQVEKYMTGRRNRARNDITIVEIKPVSVLPARSARVIMGVTN